MQSNQTPNIVLFLTDDHGAWACGSYGNTEVRTPTLDRLAAEGVRFANAFTPTPVCSPARACLLTGHTPSQVGIHDWLEEAVPEIRDRDWLGGVPTLFEHLGAAGYRTGLCGKWHLGRSDQTPPGVDFYFGLPGWQGDHNGRYTYVLNGQPLALDGNKSSIITDHALAFLDGAGSDRPFFLTIGYIATHSPYQKQAHDPQMTARYERATFRDIPAYVPHPWVKNEGLGRNPTPEELRDRYVGYYAAATEIDTQVGRVVEKLAALGQLERTIVIYTSDHGCTLGHHGFWGKGNSTRPLNMYDHSLRVPLIWRGPGIAGGQVAGQLVDHYDTFLTMLERAGALPEARASFPGSSYARLLAGEPAPWDGTRFGEYGDLRMVRTGDWKLVVRYPAGPHDLFDLNGDPGETRNLAGDTAYATVIERLSKQIDHFYATYENPARSGLLVGQLPRHNTGSEAWRDGIRERRV